MRRTPISALALAGGLVFSACGSERPLAQRTQPLVSGGDLANARDEAVGVLLSSGNVLVAGGTDGATTHAGVEQWDPVAGTWSANGDLSVGRKLFTATQLSDGSVVFVGGHATNSGELWDATGSKRAIADDGAHLHHTAHLLASGSVLVVGGDDGVTLVQPRLYNPSSNAWSDAGTLTTMRELHSSVHLADDRVVALGGLLTSPSTYLKSVEVYDPGSNSWKESGQLSLARARMATAIMADGRVLLAGGGDGTPSSVVDIWDPSLGVGSATTSLGIPREGATAVTLATGRVLVIGGDTTGGGVANTTEVFDATSGKWSPGPTLAGPRRDAVAVVVGGRILVIGGHDGTAPLKSTEVFGGVGEGGACTIDEECIGGKCSSGRCGDETPDAGPDDSGGPPVIDGTFRECTSPSECPSGFCVEGVCCDKACTGKCESCSLPDTPGKCTVQPFGTDKKAKCGAAGGCVGTCDGKGSCIGATAGTQCAPVRCIGPAKGQGAAYCPAKGAACPTAASATFDCTPFVCESALGACRASCGTSQDCAPGFACDTSNGRCVQANQTSDDGCASSRGRPVRSGLGLSLIALCAAGLLSRGRRRP